MSDETRTEIEPEPTEPDRKVEVWVWLAAALALAMVAAWVLVFLRLGLTSVQVHAMVIPTLGSATLLIMAIGLVMTIFRPPVLRTSRTVGFVLLLATGYVGNVPLVAPPLATEGWRSDVEHRLPFEGTWRTLAGGDDRSRNYKATTAAFRWAYAFTKVEDGEAFALDGKKNEDWHCFGEPVLAPAPGKVVQAVGDVVDNNPGEVTSSAVFGNHVVLRVAPDEYLFVASLRHDTLAVKVGDEVSAGARLGDCGNSGYIAQHPQIHVHAQDRKEFPLAQGLPLRFVDFRRGDSVVDVGTPRGNSAPDVADGEIVSPD